MFLQVFLLFSSIKLVDAHEDYDGQDSNGCPDSYADLTISTITGKKYRDCYSPKVSFAKTGDDKVTDIPQYLFYNSEFGELIISSEILTIGLGAFYRCTIKKVNFEKTSKLTTIGNDAFYSASFEESITFPNSLDTIGNAAFSYCQSSITVKFPNSMQRIGEFAFISCLNLAANDGITIKASGSIGNNAFQNCPKLNGDLTIEEPENDVLSTIGEYAFQNSAIKHINLPHLRSIGQYAFQNCLLLSGFTTEKADNELYVDTISNNAFENDINLHFKSIRAVNIQNDAFKYCRNLGSNIVIIDGGTIGGNSFQYCTSLGKLTIDLQYLDENVILNNNGLTISGYAFDNSGLSDDLVIPYTIGTIGQNAFSNCPNIKSLTIESTYSIQQTISKQAFYKSTIGSNLNIPASVISIEQEAFAFSSISSLIIEGTSYIFINPTNNKPIEIYTTINQDAFANCRNLNSVTFKDGFIDYDTAAFHESPLSSISLGKIESIPNEAFLGMINLRGKIEIPDTVTSIGERAFSECYNIENIFFTANSRLTTLNQAAFYRCTSLRTCTIPDCVNNIQPYTFYQCSSLQSITIPSQAENIYSYAFYECSSLTCKITLHGGLQSIGQSAFQGCYNLNGQLTFPDSLGSIGEAAFMGCSGFTGGLTFCKEITTIGTNAFRDCTGFNENLIFLDYRGTTPNNLYIRSGAFYGCSSLKGDLNIPSRCQLVYSSGSSSRSVNVFNGCSGLDGQLIIPISMRSIPSGTFSGCSLLKGQLNTNFQYVGSNAFRDCSSLSGPLDLTSLSSPYYIYSYSFYNCKGLNGQLLLPVLSTGSSFTIQEYAFAGCSGLTGSIEASSIGSVGRYGFAGCSQLNGQLNFATLLTRVDEYAFSGCSGFSDTLTFHIDSSKLTIERNAFEGCSGFKDGTLNFYMEYKEDTANNNHYFYDYFLKIGNKAFKDTKFKNIYYLGRFQPDCDYDIGISKTKGIHTSSNYANKTFCNNPLHHNKLSGGAIAGIVIAVIVVVAAIVVLIVFLILRNKKNKDNSEAEVEMNHDP